MDLWENVHTGYLAFFRNAENSQVANWQIATDILIADIKANVEFTTGLKIVSLRMFLTLRNKK